jgi:hypothetical protein
LKSVHFDGSIRDSAGKELSLHETFGLVKGIKDFMNPRDFFLRVGWMHFYKLILLHIDPQSKKYTEYKIHIPRALEWLICPNGKSEWLPSTYGNTGKFKTFYMDTNKFTTNEIDEEACGYVSPSLRHSVFFEIEKSHLIISGIMSKSKDMDTTSFLVS